MKKVITLFLLCLLTMPMMAQEDKADEGSAKQVDEDAAALNLGADIMSRYIWRGYDYGNSPAIQPTMYFSWKGLNIGAWGSYAFASHSVMIDDTTTVDAGNYAEMDLFVSYTYKWFTLMFFDFYCPNPVDPNYTGLKGFQYFNYNNTTTGHTFELSLTFEGPDAFPIKFFAGTLIYGLDKAKDTAGFYADPEKQNYSTYLELSYPVKFRVVDLNFFAGGTPFGGSWYGPKAGFTNVGLTAKKEIPVTKNYSIPIQASLITNPLAQKVYLTFGISF